VCSPVDSGRATNPRSNNIRGRLNQCLMPATTPLHKMLFSPRQQVNVEHRCRLPAFPRELAAPYTERGRRRHGWLNRNCRARAVAGRRSRGKPRQVVVAGERARDRSVVVGARGSGSEVPLTERSPLIGRSESTSHSVAISHPTRDCRPQVSTDVSSDRRCVRESVAPGSANAWRVRSVQSAARERPVAVSP